MALIRIDIENDKGYHDFSIEFGYDGQKQPQLNLIVLEMTREEASTISLDKLAIETTSALLWIKSKPTLVMVDSNSALKFSCVCQTDKGIEPDVTEMLRVLHVIFSTYGIEKAAKKDPKYATLVAFRTHLQAIKCAKQTLPKKSRRLSEFEPCVAKQKLEKSSSSVTSHHKKNSSNTYYVKKHDGMPGKIIEIESAIAALHRAFLGYDRAPKNRAVYDDEDRRVSLSSKAIPGFVSFHQRLKAEYQQLPTNIKKTRLEFQSEYNYGKLVDKGLIELLVSEYLFAENDLHEGNWGFNEHGDIVRIDLGQAFWFEVSKFVSIHPNQKGRGVKLEPAKAFPVCKEEITSFPKRTKTLAYNALINPGTPERPNPFYDKQITSVINHPDFNRRKWTAFLKAILMPETLVAGIMRQYIGSEKSAHKYTTLFLDRQNAIRTALLDLNAFKEFIQKEGDKALAEILKDIENNYNKKEKHDKYNLNEVTAAYEKIKVATVTVQALNNTVKAEIAVPVLSEDVRKYSLLKDDLWLIKNTNKDALQRKYIDLIHTLLTHHDLEMFFSDNNKGDKKLRENLFADLETFAKNPSDACFLKLFDYPIVYQVYQSLAHTFTDAEIASKVSLHHLQNQQNILLDVLPNFGEGHQKELQILTSLLIKLGNAEDEAEKSYLLAYINIYIHAHNQDTPPKITDLQKQIIDIINAIDENSPVTIAQKQKCLQAAFSRGEATVNKALIDAQRLLVRAKLPQLTHAKTAMATCIDKLPAEAIHLHAAKTKILAWYDAQLARIKKQLEKSQSLEQLEELLTVIEKISERITAHESVIDALSQLHEASDPANIMPVADNGQSSRQHHEKLHQQGRAMFKASDQLAADYLKKYETPITQLETLKSTISLSTQLVSNPLENTEPNRSALSKHANSLVRHTSRARTILDIITVIVGTASLIAATALAVTGVGLPIALGLYGSGSLLLFGGGISFFSERHRTAVNRAANGLADKALASSKLVAT